MNHALRTTILSLAILSPAPALAQFPMPRLLGVMPPGGAAGTNVDVTLSGTDLEGANAIWFDHPGLRAFHLKGLTFRLAIAPGTPAGRHDLRAVTPLGVTNPRIFVVGDQPEVREAEPNNLPAQANPIALNATISGQITPTDIDCFRFEGRKGRRVFLELWAARLDSRLEAQIRVFGPDNREVAQLQNQGGPDLFLDLVLPADGAYTVKLHDVSFVGSPDHVYRLSMHDRPHLDAVLPTVAPAADASSITLFGRNLGGTPCPELRLDGQVLERKFVNLFAPGSWGGPPLDPGFDFTPAHAAGRRGFSIRAEGASGPSNTLFVAEAIDPVVLEREPNDGTPQAQRLNLPCDIAGALGSVGDQDVYRFQGRKGDVWRVEAWAERIGSPADPVLIVQRVPDKGEPQDLAAADDLPDQGGGPRFFSGSVDAQLRWQVPEDGTYQVVLSDQYRSQRGDLRLTYRLNIRPERPDFAVFVVPESPITMEAVTVRAGGRARANAVAVRLDGYNGPIRVEAVELPAGLTCEPVVIGPGQTQAPVIIEAALSAHPTVATLRWIGRGLSGDRKELLDWTKGALAPRPERLHEARAGGMVWPQYTTIIGQILPGPARLTNGFVVAVREGAPFLLNARPSHWDVAPGTTLDLDVEVVRHAGFTGAVQLTTTDLPPNMGPATAAIDMDKTSAQIKLNVPPNVPPGTYTLVVQGTGPFPFSKDPNAKQKPNIVVNEPSNPITLTVRK